MAGTKRTTTQAETVEDIPEARPAEESQLAVIESMDVDTKTGAPIRVGTPEPSDEELVQEFIAWLQEEADASNEDSMAILADMLRQAQTVESVAEALKEKPTFSGKEFTNQPFMALGFTVREGDFEDDEIPFYASVDAQHPDFPSGLVLNCGGRKVLVHLRSLKRLNAFPLPLVFTSKENRKGHTILSLALVQQRPR